ncbi:ATP-binding protein [Streptomyces aidingensis]|uniref:Serine/threonine-protein kinase RsbW n=1 Tax=Streptomyces aidingensis TaxID=910347 RepID=A0A1I1JGQ8_9ACTN|nr:ATP-binding protein [Streptomyces aidingensis]SFC44630.1 serine/threonine-protein kinase RsbW [Streptomyces aidingensis]
MAGIGGLGRSRHRYEWNLLAEAREIESLRGRVGDAVRSLGGDTDAVESARLGVSELLANAVQHVEDPHLRLVVLRERGAVFVKLFDRSPKVPAVSTPDWDSDSGRGLWLLREMTDAMGYTCTPTGKWVWFRCPLAKAEVAA